MKTILITGFNGFVGKHACREFRSKDYYIIGVSDKPGLDGNDESLVDEAIYIDLTDSEAVKKLPIEDVGTILNLAGIATNTGGDPELIKRVNVSVHTVLYDEFVRRGVPARALAISSSTVYESVDGLPQTELSPLKDPEIARPYEASKILMERTLSRYDGTCLEVITIRPFNHVGPHQRPGAIVPDLAEQLYESVQTGLPIMVGDLSSRRDYTSVKDVVCAYLTLADSDNLSSNVYNICSGKSLSGEELLGMLKAGFNASEIEVKKDPAKHRPNEIKEIIGSHDLLTKDTGWTPKESIESTVADFVEWFKSTKV
jgi:GDP-4-dehydro-6-deoxy-D-mannose reductase